VTVTEHLTGNSPSKDSDKPLIDRQGNSPFQRLPVNESVTKDWNAGHVFCHYLDLERQREGERKRENEKEHIVIQ
jgi:hypothetical protein